MNPVILPTILPQPSTPSGMEGNTGIKEREDFPEIFREVCTENKPISFVIDEGKREGGGLIESPDDTIVGSAFVGGYCVQGAGDNQGAVTLEDMFLKLLQLEESFKSKTLETQEAGPQDAGGKIGIGTSIDNLFMTLISRNQALSKLNQLEGAFKGKTLKTQDAGIQDVAGKIGIGASIDNLLMA